MELVDLRRPYILPSPYRGAVSDIIRCDGRHARTGWRCGRPLHHPGKHYTNTGEGALSWPNPGAPESYDDVVAELLDIAANL